MIRITIEQIVTRDYGANESHIISEIPARNVDGNVALETTGYDRGERAVFEKKYEVREVVKQKEITLQLLKQEIPVDSDFDLPATIRAINNLDWQRNGKKAGK